MKELRCAPKLQTLSTRNARKWPSASSASDTLDWRSRAWESDWNDSFRVDLPPHRPPNPLRGPKHQRLLLNAHAVLNQSLRRCRVTRRAIPAPAYRECGRDQRVGHARSARRSRACCAPFDGRSLRRRLRISIGLTATREMSVSIETTCAALAKAAAAAASSPAVCTKQTLSGASSQTAGAPGFSRSAVSVTDGKTS